MAFWLMKSEPDVYPWARLVRDQKGVWDGVRNHLAKKHLQTMKKGDLAFFYHSNIGKEIVGILRITQAAHPDPTDPEGVFVQVGVAPLQPFSVPVTLAAIKADPALATMALLRQSRLSVQPVTPAEWKRICAKGKIARGIARGKVTAG